MSPEDIAKARSSAQKGREVWPLLDLPDMLDEALDEVERLKAVSANQFRGMTYLNHEMIKLRAELANIREILDDE